MVGNSMVYGFLGFLLDGVLLGLAGHLAFSVPLWYMSRKRGLKASWLAWLPLGNLWFLGALSDQYACLVAGRKKHRRWWLPAMGGVTSLLTVAGALWGLYGSPGAGPALWATVLDLQAGALWCLVLLTLYPVYSSCAPNGAAGFFVLSLFVPVAIPLFLILNGGKELGMPPRREAFLQSLQQTRQLHWPVRQTSWQPAPTAPAEVAEPTPVPGAEEI